MLDPLAREADLPERWLAAPDATRALDIASAAIREAAGSAISQQTSTITVPAPSGRLLPLPSPVASVASVSIDGTPVTDYALLTEGLWRRQGWGCGPAPVTVTLTHGLAEVPADIVDLAVQLATAWLAHTESGGGSTAGVTSVRIDDAAETYDAESAGQVSPVFIPEITRQSLAARFGGGPVVVETL